MEHDQRFKTLLRTFFADFLRLFFADWAARFDLSNIEWLDKEMLPHAPDGPLHVLDMVARVRATQAVEGIHGDEPWLVLVHVEIESPDQTTLIKPRLPHYYHHLRAVHGCPVLPIVIYLNVQLDGVGIDVYRERFWDLEVVVFHNLYVGLPGLDGVKYVEGENWLGVALAALMRIPPERAVWLGAEALRRLTGAPLSPHQRFLLAECVQAYLKLDEKQKREYYQLLQSEVYAEVRSMNKTVFEEGIEKGIEKGKLIGLQELALTLLEERFGPVSTPLREYVENLSLDPLRQLTLRILNAKTLADAGLSQFKL